MRIMEIVSGTAVNGAVVTCVETTRALIELGHDVTLICRPDAWVAEQLESEFLAFLGCVLSSHWRD